MNGRISSIGYINKISNNVLKIRKSELLPLFTDLKTADCIICGGSGRSMYSLNTAMSQIAKIKYSKVVITPEDAGFPGRNMYYAASDLEGRYNQIMLLINSGSGESGDPKTLAEDLGRYIDETGSKKFSMGLITSNTQSSIASTVRKYGNVVKVGGVGGRKGEASSGEYSETGIMGDVFELSSLSILQAMGEAVYGKEDVDKVFELLEEEFPKMGKMIDRNLGSIAYKSVLNLLERRSDLFLGGRGTANEVAKMA